MMQSGERDRLCRDLRARITLFATTLDVSVVLGAQALARARALMAVVPDARADREAAELVAMLCAIRARFMPSGSRDAGVAEDLLELVGEQLKLRPQGATRDRPAAGGGRVSSAALPSEGPVGCEAALHAARAALAAAPRTDHVGRASALRQLGSELRQHHERTGALRELNSAVSIHREALSESGSAHPHRAAMTSGLSLALRARFEATGALQDLEEAVALAAEAVRETPNDDVNYPGRLHNWALALRQRAARLGTAGDLAEAVELHHQALAAAPANHPGVETFRCGLSNALRELARARPPALSRAQELAQEVLSKLPANDPRRARAALSLAESALQGVARVAAPDARALSLARRAVSVLRDCAGLLDPLHPDQASVQVRLGMALSFLGQLALPGELAASEQSDAALLCFRKAAAHVSGALDIRIHAARLAGVLAAGRGDVRQAALDHAGALELLHGRLPLHLAYADAEQILRQGAGIGREAAACFVEAGEVSRAVEVLELSRGALLGQSAQREAEWGALEGRAPELAARLRSLQQALLDHRFAEQEPGGGEEAEVRYSLCEEWEEALRRARALPRLERFLCGPALAELRSAARGGPLVYLNSSSRRCDALVVDGDGARSVGLAEVSEGALADEADRLELALRAGDEAALLRSLSWLWDAVAEPVLVALGLRGPPAEARAWPRLWWIPTGPFARLPVHAAGRHRAPGDSLIDRAISSYCPSVSGLLEAQRRLAASRVSALIVSAGDAPEAQPLPGARQEAESLSRWLPGARRLDGPRATKDAVLSALKDHCWLHFSGHAWSDPVSPSRSRLVLHDHATRPLTLGDICRLRLRAEFAYLSACGTARAGRGLEDEALHPTSALHSAGFRHVVGTAWDVDDGWAGRMAEAIYFQIAARRPHAERAAHAVHHAVRAMRAQILERPSLWAAYVHVGP